MIITKKHLSRRTFVRGTLGATIALPFLDAMVPALSAAPKSPFRFGAVYFPCGVFPDTWHPEKEGSDFEFKPVMQPLEPFRNQLVTVSKMKAPWGSSVHLGASSAFLNGVGPVVQRDGNTAAFGEIHSKKTVDQFIADQVAGDTPLRSIEVGTEDMGTAVGACDGFACTFFNTLVVARRYEPAAGGDQSARHLRANVRRDGFDRAALCPPQGEAEPARLGDRGNRETETLAGSARSRHPRRVSRQHSRRGKAARTHGKPSRHHHRQSGSAGGLAGSVRRSHDHYL